MAEPSIPTTFHMNAKLRVRLDKALAKGGGTLRGAFEAGIELWLKQGGQGK